MVIDVMGVVPPEVSEKSPLPEVDDRFTVSGTTVGTPVADSS